MFSPTLKPVYYTLPSSLVSFSCWDPHTCGCTRCSAGQKGVLPASDLLTVLQQKQPVLWGLSIQSSRSVKNDGCTDTQWLRKIVVTAQLDKKEPQASHTQFGQRECDEAWQTAQSSGHVMSKSNTMLQGYMVIIRHTCWYEISFLPSHPSPPFSVPWLSPVGHFLRERC